MPEIIFDIETDKKISRLVKKIDAVESAKVIDRHTQARLYNQLDEFAASEQQEAIKQLDKLANDRNVIVEPEGGWYVVPKPVVEAAKVVVTMPEGGRKTRTRVNDGDVTILADCIVDALTTSKKPMTKGEIENAIGGDKPSTTVWNKAIAKVVSERGVKVTGQKRGTRYSIA